eukprot:3451751-Heterocapsa_arctica.AAC.1
MSAACVHERRKCPPYCMTHNACPECLTCIPGSARSGLHTNRSASFSRVWRQVGTRSGSTARRPEVK